MLSTAHDRHEDLTALVTGLPDDAVMWTPCADAPALAGLVLHILDVEGHLAAIAAGEDDHWAGENGSHILDGATGAALRDAIFDLEARMRAMFASIDDARLEALPPVAVRRSDKRCWRTWTIARSITARRNSRGTSGKLRIRTPQERTSIGASDLRTRIDPIRVLASDRGRHHRRQPGGRRAERAPGRSRREGRARAAPGAPDPF